ncbi:MAG: hypothetical protein K2X32_01890 [Phycisphaerales bacterium]|nr:hypothetical protein [Phycisphaerales bacterium]
MTRASPEHAPRSTPRATIRAASPASTRPAGRFAELHLHLGGAVLPNILHAYLRRVDHPLLKRYPRVEMLERYFTRPRHSLDDYVNMHKVVERVQRLDSIPYFVQRLIRGAVLFDNLAYMELRHCPWFRTDASLPDDERLTQMDEVVSAITQAAADATDHYPLVFRQILCMHSTLSPVINRRIAELAKAHMPDVVAIDLAGPDRLYAGALGDVLPLFRRARTGGLHTTAHLFETPQGSTRAVEKLLPHLDRIGHGIQIPLRRPTLLKAIARREQCLEICPTSYVRTGTLTTGASLRAVFRKCFDTGVPVAICTDNSGMHSVRLPHEYESLLVNDIISFSEMAACHDASFRHAFAWSGPTPRL